MKRILLFLILICSGLAHAQRFNINVGGLPITSGASVPASCSVAGALFYKTTATVGWYWCNGTTYSPFGTGAGTVTGTGTANTIAKWSGAAALTNSGMTDDGTTINTTELITQTNTDTTTGNLNSTVLTQVLNPSATKTGNTNILSLTNSSSMTQPASGRLRGLLVTLNPQSTGLITRTEAMNVGNFATGTSNFNLTIAGLFDAEAVTTAGTDAENDAIRVQSGAAGSGGTITTDTGVQIPAPSTTGTMTHHYGLWFGDHSQNPGGRNPDGWAIFDTAQSKYQLGRIFTTQNCSAVGTGASPSVASCSSAISGAFSCATNASAGLCRINTTSVNTTSNIFVTFATGTVLNTRLGVTCNTAPTVMPAVPIAAIVASTSFDINAPTFTTNPVCGYYWIVN